jgi:hypothetical protein
LNFLEVQLVVSKQNKIICITHTQIADAAEKGDPNAQLMLGWYYYIGHGITPDKSIAVAWYQKAAANGLPEAKRLLELVSSKSDKPTIANIVNGGQPIVSRWVTAGKVLFLVLTISLIASISYYYWPKHQQPVVVSDKSVVPSTQYISMNKEPNLYVEKEDTIAEDTPIVNQLTTESKPNILLTNSKELIQNVEVKENEIIVDSNSSKEDPNFVPTPIPDTKIKQLVDMVNKWLEQTPTESN